MGLLENPEWIAAVTGAFTALGLGIRYVLKRMDTTTARVDAEREKLETAFNARIDQLETVIEGQRSDLRFMQAEMHSYARHVGVLEGILKANGIDAPPMAHAHHGRHPG